MGFDIDGKQFGTLDVRSIVGKQAAGFYRLLFQLRFNVYPSDRVAALMDLEAGLTVRGPQGSDIYVGRGKAGRAAFPIRSSKNLWEGSVTIEFEFDRRRLEAIEVLRAGGGLVFTMSIEGMGYSADGPRTSKCLTENVNHVLNRGTWVEVLQQVGYSDIDLIELPSLGEGSLTHASREHLQNVQRFISEGYYREAVGACRDAIEAMSQTMLSVDKSFEKERNEKNPDDWSKGARLLGIRKALLKLCHPSRHADERAAHIDWTRDDAVAVAWQVVALLRMTQAL